MLHRVWAQVAVGLVATAAACKRTWITCLCTLACIDAPHVIVLYFLLSRRAVPASMQAHAQVAIGAGRRTTYSAAPPEWLALQSRCST